LDPIYQYKQRSGAYFGLHSYETVATLYEIMELNDFPFDMQNLNISFALEGAWKKSFRLYVHQLDIKCSHNGTNIAEDWEMCAPVCSRKNDYQTVLSLVVSRRWFHEVVNVIGVTTLLTALSMITFANPPEHVGDRLTVVLTLTLTVVANKTNTSSSLPHVPYATCIDYFFWLATTYMAFVACMASWPANWCYHSDQFQNVVGAEEQQARLEEIRACFDGVLFDGSDVRNFQICGVIGE
jgi:hypothetical protein